MSEIDREPDWGLIKTDYVTGDLGYREIAKKYKISMNTLTKRAGREGWPKARQEARNRIAARVQRKTETAIANQEAARVSRLLVISDRLLDKLDQAVDELDRAMVKRKKRTRTIQYTDPGAPGKPTKEIINDDETIETCQAPLDRIGIQQLSLALKNIRDVQAGSASQEDDDTNKRLNDIIDRIDKGMQDDG